jgi:hypothetical protein
MKPLEASLGSAGGSVCVPSAVGPADPQRRRVLRSAAAGVLAALTGAGCGGGGGSPCTVETPPQSGAAPAGASDVVLHPVPIPLSSVRLTYMSKDSSGFIWAASNQMLTRYDPSTGHMDAIPHPFNAVIGHSMALGGKVYMLGVGYPRLMVYDPVADAFSELPYPVANADVWYAAEEIHGRIDGRHMYLFNRSSAAVIKWDTLTDTGTVIPYPYNTPSPYIGRHIPADGAIWCNVWDFSGGLYAPVGIARLDLATDQFNGFFPFPADGASLAPYTDPAGTLFYQWSFEGKLMPFDVAGRRFCRFIDVPGYKESFRWIGQSMVHSGRWYFVRSNLSVHGLGFDCKPAHFLNSLLEFDPATGEFAVATLEVPGAYYQVSYILSADGEFYANCNNILEADGQLNIGRVGELLYWQSTPV